MVRPLTKRKKSGELYEHPPEIARHIEGALGQDLATLTLRAQERDPKSPEYLRSECLVHLIREAIRQAHEATYNALLPILLGRCEERLKAKIPDSVPQAEQLREEVLGELSLLFAKDAASDASGELDFYECKFDKAFMTLRFDVLDKEANKTARRVPLSDGSTRSDEGESEGRECVPEVPATQSERLDQEELLNMLPLDERKAVILCDIMGYRDESPDPDEETAATLCGVSGRTIRSRLKRGREQLKRAIQGNT